MKYIKNYNTFILEDINYPYKSVTTLIDLNIPLIIDGNFNCINKQLTSLKGSPKDGFNNFYCFDNNLTTLEGAPSKVGEDFNCYNNKLITLEGAPKKVGGYFDCTKNKLTSLEYLPEYIGGILYCYDNEWTKPIPYKIMSKFKLHCLEICDIEDDQWVYTDEQFNKFSSFEFQKEFLEREPENYFDLKPIGYAEGIEELFPHLFDMDELGLID